MSKATTSPKVVPSITSDMIVREIIALFPGAADIMIEYGLHCFSCSLGGVETLQEGADMHGFDAETLNMLLVDINEEFAAQPQRPQLLVITADAARGIAEVSKQENREGQHVKIIVDEQGGFCMEFIDTPSSSDHAFMHAEEPNVKVYADALTLSRIGGATIDVREGRFKLDLPEDCCGESTSCSCKGE